MTDTIRKEFDAENFIFLHRKGVYTVTGGYLGFMLSEDDVRTLLARPTRAEPVVAQPEPKLTLGCPRQPEDGCDYPSCDCAAPSPPDPPTAKEHPEFVMGKLEYLLRDFGPVRNDECASHIVKLAIAALSGLGVDQADGRVLVDDTIVKEAIELISKEAAALPEASAFRVRREYVVEQLKSTLSPNQSLPTQADNG